MSGHQVWAPCSLRASHCRWVSAPTFNTCPVNRHSQTLLEYIQDPQFPGAPAWGGCGPGRTPPASSGKRPGPDPSTHAARWSTGHGPGVCSPALV